MRGKPKDAGNKDVRAEHMPGTASAHDIEKLINELRNRIRFLEKELQSRQDELHAREGKYKQQSQKCKRAVLVSREDEARFQILADDAPVLIWMNGLEGCEFVNRAYLEFLGVSGQVDVQHYDWAQYIHPDDREGYLNRYLDSFKRQAPFDAVFRFRRHDGMYRWMKSTGRPHFSSTGEFLGYVGSTQDITDIKQAEQELRKGQQLLHSFIEGTSDAIYLKDLRSRYLLFNSAAEGFTGKKASDVIGKDDTFLFPPDEAKAVMDIDRVIIDSGKQQTYEEMFTVPSGKQLTFLTTKGPLLDEGGNVTGIFGITRDITERKRAESEKKKLIHNLQERIKELTAMYRVMEIVAQQKPVSGLLQEVVSILPAAWQYPEITVARLLFDGQEYRTPGYASTRWTQSARFSTDDAREGLVEIVYLEERPEAAEGPFLAEERNLINSLAQILEVFLDRKISEETLRDSQTHLSSVFRAAPTGIGVVVDRVIKEVNDRLCEMTGYKSEELLGKSARIFYPTDEDYEYVGLEKYDQIRRRGTGSVETRWLRKDGRVIDVLLSSTPLNPGDLSAGVTFTALDITERKRAEERIAHLASFPELNPNPIFEVSTTGLVRYANPAAKHLFPDLAMLRTDHPILSGFNAIVDELRWGKSYMVRDIKFKDAYLQQTINLVPERETIRFYMLDITKRKRAEEALKEAKTDAELYLDLMGHDISNMHQIILGNLELVHDIMEFEGRPESGNKELIDNSIATLQRGAKLIENIRNIQKLRRGELELEVTDLGKLLDRTVKGYSGLPGRDVSISYEPVHGCYVMANVLLKDVFDNLVENAVKHCDDPVRIWVSVVSAEISGRRYYRVVVEDNGRGIPDNMKSVIFSRLERGETKERGTGLGLSIVKMLAEGFGGTVSVEDRVPGDRTKGARFVVMLPVA